MVPVWRPGENLRLGSFRQNASCPVVVPVWRPGENPEIGFVPSKWQLAGCGSHLEPGDGPEIGFLRKWRDHPMESETYGRQEKSRNWVRSAKSPLISGADALVRAAPPGAALLRRPGGRRAGQGPAPPQRIGFVPSRKFIANQGGFLGRRSGISRKLGSFLPAVIAFATSSPSRILFFFAVLLNGPWLARRLDQAPGRIGLAPR